VEDDLQRALSSAIPKIKKLAVKKGSLTIPGEFLTSKLLNFQFLTSYSKVLMLHF
jgi:hypothetical protein